MRVVLLANQRSGVGRSPRLVREIGGTLEHSGVEVVHIAAAPGAAQQINRHLARCDALVAVGGDGTVHHSIGELLRTGVPFYHVPAGNENLLAREFGTTGSPGAVVAAVRAGRIRELDVGLAEGRPFLIMLSVGPDAAVVHRLHAVRSATTGHAMYLGPISQEISHPHLAALTVRVDGRTLVESSRGELVIANCRQYATRLNPAAGASMTDGLLDVAFMPAEGIAGLVAWGIRCAVGAQADCPGWIEARGRSITVESDAPAPWQFDGERGAWIEPGRPLEIGIADRKVGALVCD